VFAAALGLGALGFGVLSLGAWGLAWAAAPPPKAPSSALWRVVHDLCLGDKTLIGRSAPCLAIDRKKGVAVVPDPRRPTQVLLVPTRRIAGIESPALLSEKAVNYWQAAWDARRYFERRVGRPVPRDRIGMAINAILSRSQDQLHIHVDCVRPEVRQALKAREDEIGPTWSPLGIPLVGRHYQVRRLDGSELGSRNPFQLLARDLPGAGAAMGRQSLAVIGAEFADGSPGFILLGDGSDGAFAESLLDHRCAVLTVP
jgi:CDP-diacylglycerol pyrophosphatase